LSFKRPEFISTLLLVFVAGIVCWYSLQRYHAVMSGEVANPMNPPAGCRLHLRCPEAMPVQHRSTEVAGSHARARHRLSSVHVDGGACPT
jgi:ABC-type dipeptide/oligopeptide/nickel transport system ATPase component